MDEERIEQAATESPQEAAGQQEKPVEEELPLPPPTFEFLTLSLRMQAEAHLGLIGWGEGERPKPDFRRARHTIDLMAMLEEKTRGNLTTEEKRLLENTLTELRFRYVQILEESRKKS
ncbi:MAG: DUF1844 domain-containing protein [Bryobacteraceae bacterium]